MNTAWLIHGTDGGDTDYFWFADTKKFLEAKGYEVWWPLLPNTERPELEVSRTFVKDNMPAVSGDTIVIGHSSACPLLLTVLPRLGKSINQLILVSGFYQSIDDEGFSELMLQPEPYDWEAIKHSAKDITLINSDNDPWGCNDQQARPVAKELGARFILAKGQGHMGSDSFSQPYKEFPLLKELLK